MNFSKYYTCIAIAFMLSALWHPDASAQLVISGGSNMFVKSGTPIISKQNLNIYSGAKLNVQGTLVLTQDLINLNSSNDTLGNGVIELSGTSVQSISGQNVIGSLKINNSSGVNISGNTYVNGILTLSNGRISLGTHNLTLGSSAIINGIPSASNMIIATGTGEVRKQFGGIGSFTFPVGDQTSVPEYSPVVLNFTAGTFGSGNYVGINLVDAKYNNDSITGSYLTRYWNITSSGISAFTCNATFKYLDSDIVGNESSIYCVKVNPAPWISYNVANTVTNELTANNLSSFSTFTGAKGGGDFNFTAFLEGPYNSGQMNTTLNSNGLLPLSQPYNNPPWNYTGGESVGSIPAGMVDWVLIELRQADQPANATAATIIKKRAAFLKNNGSIVETDGTSPVRFYNTIISQNLYPVIYHRSHMPIMSNNAVTMINGIYTYDYSSSASQIYPGSGTGCKQLGSLYGMIGGDANNDGSVYANDYTSYWVPYFGTINTYQRGDFNMDGNVYTNDYTSFWVPNFGKTNPLP